MKPKILFVIPSLESGGAEKLLISILNELPRKYDATILILHETGEYLSLIPNWVKIIRGPKPYKTKKNLIFFNEKINRLQNIFFDLKQKIYRNLISRTPKIARLLLLQGKNYELEIAFLEGITCHLVSNWGGSSIKWGWIHTDPIGAKHVTLCNTYKKLDKIICVSEPIRLILSQQNYAPLEKLEVIHNFVNSSKLKALSNEPVNVGKKGTTAIYVGRLSKEKGVERLINSIHILKTQGHNLNLWIVGDGILKNQLKEQCNNLHLNENVQFFGFLLNPYPLMMLADFLVSPSDFEGFSLSIAEALYLGTPVVSTRTLGPIELLKNGDLGILCDINDVSLATALIEMSSMETRKKHIERIEKQRHYFGFDLSIKLIEASIDKSLENIIARQPTHSASK